MQMLSLAVCSCYLGLGGENTCRILIASRQQQVGVTREQGSGTGKDACRLCADGTLPAAEQGGGGAERRGRAHMEGSLKSRSPRERETARPVLVPRAVLMMRQQRCISTRPPQPSTRARSLSSPGLWSARHTLPASEALTFPDSSIPSRTIRE